MKQILARKAVFDGVPAASPQLISIDNDGHVVGWSDFRNETPCTVYENEPIYVSSFGSFCTHSEYEQALIYLNDLGAFHNIGSQAYKPGLQHIRHIDTAFGSPSQKFHSVHVAGTNGKGSTASTLAAVMTSAGYVTGLYTSPHLTDFRERIVVDGHMIPQSEVVSFVNGLRSQQLPFTPSYFEAVTAMAFYWFAKRKVDVAVIEVGLGGRLDSTNIIHPLLSIITNISLDHQAILGNTEVEISIEKAGIIKDNAPVVIGSARDDVRNVFVDTALRHHSPIVFAQDNRLYTSTVETDNCIEYSGTPWGKINSELCGEYQTENAATIFNALVVLSQYYDITPEAVGMGFANVSKLTRLNGRWSQRDVNGRRLIYDIGHNIGAWQFLGAQLEMLSQRKRLYMVIGFLRDKDLQNIVYLMPKGATYFFVTPASERARSATETAEIFSSVGITGSICNSPEDGIRQAMNSSSAGDIIFVGGSTFTASAAATFV